MQPPYRVLLSGVTAPAALGLLLPVVDLCLPCQELLLVRVPRWLTASGILLLLLL